MVLVSLRAALHSSTELYHGAEVYIRGDANTNPNHTIRFTLFAQLLSDFDFKKMEIGHNIHYHFMDEGAQDAPLDVLIHSSSCPHPETLPHSCPIMTSWSHNLQWCQLPSCPPPPLLRPQGYLSLCIGWCGTKMGISTTSR